MSNPITIGRLKQGDLTITGDIMERLPANITGMTRCFPFDGQFDDLKMSHSERYFKMSDNDVILVGTYDNISTPNAGISFIAHGYVRCPTYPEDTEIGVRVTYRTSIGGPQTSMSVSIGMVSQLPEWTHFTTSPMTINTNSVDVKFEIYKVSNETGFDIEFKDLKFMYFNPLIKDTSSTTFPVIRQGVSFSDSFTEDVGVAIEPATDNLLGESWAPILWYDWYVMLDSSMWKLSNTIHDWKYGPIFVGTCNGIAEPSIQLMMGFGSGNTFSTSMMIRTTKSTTKNLTLAFLDSGDMVINSFTNTFTFKRDVWTYITFENCVLDAGQFPYSIKLMFDTGWDEDVVIECARPQIEEKPFCTEWVQNSRPDPILITSFNGTPNYDGTVVIDIYRKFINPVEEATIIDMGAARLFLIGNTLKLTSEIYGIDAIVIPNIIQNRTRYRIGFTWDSMGVSNIYVNGELAGTISTDPYVSMGFENKLYIGMDRANSTILNGIVYGLVQYNRVLNPDEMRKLFNNPALSIQKDGSIRNKVMYGPLDLPSDAHYSQLSLVRDKNNNIPIVTGNTYNYGGWSYVGPTKTNLLPSYDDPFNTVIGTPLMPIVYDNNGTYRRRLAKYQFIGETGAETTASIWVSTNTTYAYELEIFVSEDYQSSNNIFGTISSPFIEAVNISYDLARKGTWQKIKGVFTTGSDPYVDFKWCPVPSDSGSPSGGFILYRDEAIYKGEYSVPGYNGTRPSNSTDLHFNLHRDLGLDWSGDWTIMYWKRPLGTDTERLDGYNIDSLGAGTNTIGGGYLWFGKNHLDNNLTVQNGNMQTPINAIDYFDKNILIALIKTGNTIKAKWYGVHKDPIVSQVTNPEFSSRPDYFVTQHGYDLKLGGYGDVFVCAGMYRDLVVVSRSLSDEYLDAIYPTMLKYRNDTLHVIGDINETISL